jgi:hypothetical protein
MDGFMIGGKPYDVVILGAGLGGLLSAALLARRGRHVLVLEEGETPGGLSRLISRGDHQFLYGPSLFIGFEREGVYDQIFMELGLSLTSIKREGKLIRRVSPPFQLILPSHRLDFFLDNDKFVDELSREFPQDRHSIQIFSDQINRNFEDVRSIILRSHRRPRDLRGGIQALKDAMNEMFRTYRLRRKKAVHLTASLALDPALLRGIDLVLTALSGKGLNESSELDLLFILGFLRREAVAVSGGIPKLGELLVSVIRKFHGEVLYSQRVSEIVIERKRVTQIRCPKLTVKVTGPCIAHIPVSRLTAAGEARSIVTLQYSIPSGKLPGPMKEHVFLDSGGTGVSEGRPWFLITLDFPADAGIGSGNRRALQVTTCPEGSSPLTPEIVESLRARVDKLLNDLIPFAGEALVYLGWEAFPSINEGRMGAVDSALIARARKKGWGRGGYYTVPVHDFFILPDRGDQLFSHLWEARAAADLANDLTGR